MKGKECQHSISQSEIIIYRTEDINNKFMSNPEMKLFSLRRRDYASFAKGAKVPSQCERTC